MRLGGFGRIAGYDNTRQAGFDYTELDVLEIEALTKNEFHTFCDEVHEIGFPVLTGARALPVTKPWFLADSFNISEYRVYPERACHRAKLLGVDRIIIGNGKARPLIGGTSIKKENRFTDFMHMSAEIAGSYDVEVILEPLGPMYSNCIDSLPEVVRIIWEIGVPGLFTMVDLRYLVWVKEPLADIVSYSDYIHCIHMDYPISCPAYPFSGANGDFDYTGFLDVLKESGYQGILAIETNIPENWKRTYEDTATILHAFL